MNLLVPLAAAEPTPVADQARLFFQTRRDRVSMSINKIAWTAAPSPLLRNNRSRNNRLTTRR